MPADLVHWIIGKLCQADQADFRLVCRSWRDAYPIQHRVNLRHTADWQTSATQLRQLSQKATIVLQAADANAVVQLLDFALCDIVILDTRHPGWSSQWTLEPLHYVPDKVKETLQPLQSLQQSLPDHKRKRLELHLRIRSTQLVSPALRDALEYFSASILHLRVLESLTYFAKQVVPMTGIQVLAFSLPYRFDLLQEFHAAVQSLPSLREIHLFTCTVNATKHVNSFLRVLDSLAKVTSLRVTTRRYPLELSASHLRHITRLELSWKVTVDCPLSSCGYLCLQDIQTDAGELADTPFEGYAAMFAQLASLKAPTELCVQSCDAATLLELPSNLRHLSLLQNLENISDAAPSFLDCNQALSRLSMLKVLHIGDFLTDHVVSLLSDLIMPHVHTFGFQLNFEGKVRGKHLSQLHGHNILAPSQHVTELAAVLPALRHIKVVYTGRLKDRVTLESGFISQEYFPCLRGLTYSCQDLKIGFQGMSASCYVVSK